jgi:DNA-binding transcriptional LysR family regulator
MDRMTSMATFVKVVESEGFSAAARALGISPSMATTHVRSLEERLGVRLLNRSTRRVSLTEAGQIYYERCLQILAEVEDADRVAQALQSTPRGTLRLNTSVAIPPFLAPVIAEFVTLYPEVSINLTMTDRMIDLVEEGFDLAVRNMLIPDSSLIVRRVASYRFVVCGAPSYFAARGVPKQPADLVQHNCLIYSHSVWGNEWRFAGPDGEQSVPVSGNLQANSDNALRLAAVHGQGLALAPTFLVADEIKSGRLVPVLSRFLQTEHAINAVYPHRHHLSAKVRSFIDLLAKHFRAGPAWADPCRSPLAAEPGTDGVLVNAVA